MLINNDLTDIRRMRLEIFF